MKRYLQHMTGYKKNSAVIDESLATSTLKSSGDNEVGWESMTSSEETAMLRRYDAVFREIVRHGLPINGKCDQGSIIDWSACYAIQGSSYFDEVASSLNFTILHAALLVTIAIPAYISPPDFDSSLQKHVFVALMGLSSMCNLVCILLCTIFNTMMSRPYTDIDVMMVRIFHVHTLAGAITADYIGILALLTAVLVAGFNLSRIDGYIQLYIIFIVIIVVIGWIYGTQLTDKFQLKAAEAFKAKYCDDDGQLKDEVLTRIFGPKTIESFLDEINLSNLSKTFKRYEITTNNLKLLSRDDLIEMGVDSVTDRLNILARIDDLKSFS